jgi:hypothetical protein
VALLALCLANPLRADLPHLGPHHPGPPIRVHPANAVPVVIEASDTLTGPRLVIPRALLARARKLPVLRSAAALPGRAPAALAGLALTAALSAGGLCLARRKGRALVVLLVLGVGCAYGAGQTFLGAHPPPGNPRPPVDVVFDHAAVEVIEGGTEVRLLVPRERLGELARKLR